MKILLIDPPGWQKHSLNLGLAYLAGAIRAAGFDVLILDLNNHVYSEARLKKIITDFSPKVIGISVKTSTANVSAEIIRGLKNAFPDIVYTAGGPHITLCAKEFIRENKEIDFGIIGEGEISFIKLINNIKDGKKDIPDAGGICYRKNGSQVISGGHEVLDISRLPFPVFECVKDMDFSDFRYPLLTSRGCPYGCIFCCVGLISGKKWRARAHDDVVNELLQAKENYQLSSFEIMDDNFTFDIGRAKKICRLIIKKKLNMDWWCHNGLRADRLDRELLNLMKRAGCKSIALGIETGDKDVFSNINKGEKLADIARAVKMIKKAGIKCVGYFIVGLPGDSVESTKRSVRFQRGLGLSGYKFNMLIPYPGSRIWDIVNEKGRLLEDIKGSYHFGENIKIPFEMEGLNKETMEQCMYLAENQEWARGENSIVNIRNDFNARFGRDIKRVICIENDSRPTAQYLKIEYENANVLKIKQSFHEGEIKGQYLLEHNSECSYFDILFRVVRERECQIILDVSKKRLLIQKVKNTESEYIRAEVLPPPQEWDGSARGYFATRLKNSSPDINSANNGIIYKDDIALPFSHCPQWEKVPCGKIESGLAFISTSAFNLKSGYKADYLTSKSDSELRELTVNGGSYSALERIISESDILFCPDELEYFALVFSRAKMNVAYHCNERAQDSPEYRVLSPFSNSSKCHFIRKIRRILNRRHKIKKIFKEYIIVSGKCVKAIILWVQILTYMVLVNIKNFTSRAVKF